MFNNNSFANTSFGNTSFGGSTFGTPFGSTNTLGAFASANQPNQSVGPVGTTIRFVPITSSDTIAKTGPGAGTTQISTRHQNISAMKEYESKSTDELRLEDYAANRKHGQFGAAGSGPNTFGSTNLFGTQQKSAFELGNNSSTGIFGSLNKPTTSTANASPFQIGTGFNTATSTAGGISLFNNNPQQNSPFGVNNLNTPNKSTTLFGSAPSGTTSLFGANSSATNTSGFLGQSTQNQPFGQSNTTSSIFAPNTSQTNQTTSLFGATNTAPSATQPFSFPSTSTQQTPSLFNNSLQNDANKSSFSLPNAQPMFGSTGTNTSTFGTSNLFGSQQKSSFELGNNSNTGIFGSLNKPTTSTANASPFQIGTGFNTATSTAGGMSLFNNNPQQNSSPFGVNNLNTSNKTTNLFGAATTTTTSIFGSNTNPTNTSGFLGQSTQNQPFGQSNTTSSIFAPNTSQTNQTTSLFGATNTAPSATQPFSFPSTSTQQTPSLFNNSLQNDANKSSFSLPNAQNSTFNFGVSSSGNTMTANTSSTTVPLFGASTTNTNLGSSLFGSNNTSNLGFGTQTNQSGVFNLNSVQSPQANSISQHNQSQNLNQSQRSPDLLLNRFKTLPYGETSLLLNDSVTASPGLSSIKFTTDPKTISQYKMNAKTNVKLNKPASEDKPRGNSVLFDGLDDHNNDDLRCAIDVFVPKKNIKKLELGPIPHLTEGDADNVRESPAFEQFRGRSNGESAADGSMFTRHVRYADNTYPGDRTESDVSLNRGHASVANSGSELSSLRLNTLNRSNQSFDSSQVLPNRSISLSGVIHTRADYRIKPALEDIDRHYDFENDTCYIDSLLIERPDYGSILFESRLNVKGLNLDEIVHIRRKEVVVYPDDENKPPVGRGLNRPATVSLHQVWPIDKSNNEVIRDVNRLKLMRYPEKIESVTIEKGARFIEYRPETGTWMFAVKHFSKYGITDDDEDMVQNIPPPPNVPKDSSTPIHHMSQVALNASLPPTTMYPIRLTSNLDVIDILTNDPSNPLLSRESTSSSSVPSKSNLDNNSFIMNPKTSIKLNSSSSTERSKIESMLFNSVNETSTYSIKDVMFEFFNEDLRGEEVKNEQKRSLSVHGTKRRALQDVSPNVTTTSYNPYFPITVGSTIPKQQKVREITIRPDLFAARNRLIRDIASVCVSGSPRVRFFNGSRKFCYAQGDNVIVNELKLVPTNSDGSLREDVRERFHNFLENNSIVTSFNMTTPLAPYIETNNFIPDASSHDLLYALYGSLESKTPYAKQDERLNRVVNWLAAFNRTLPAPTGLYQLIIYHMCCDRYDLAAETAMDNDHPRLALLIATLNLNKVLMQEQLTSWRLSHADQYIDSDLMKIYIILSGQTEWKLSNDHTIHCLRGLEWTQQLCLLALHVPQSFITEPEKYYGFHMLPLYMRRLDTTTNDVNYHILARHNPGCILSSASSLIEEWFLLESLKSFHVVNSETECMQFDIIHCNLAAQLGPIDIGWACFVALHIINNEIRNQVLIKCLEQNFDQIKEVKSDAKVHGPSNVKLWLMEKLKIPTEFIQCTVSSRIVPDMLIN